jgi:hypothetical protein
MLTAVFFADPEYGWAVGHDETIINTVDGGETWTRTHFSPEAQQPLLDLWFANRVSGIAVGAYGAYFTTNDGGRHWSSAKFAPPPAKSPTHDGEAAPEEGDLPPDYHLNRIVGVGNRLYVAAEGGQLYRSDDRGASWRVLPSPTKAASSASCRFAAKACWLRPARPPVQVRGRRRDLDAARLAHHRDAHRRHRHQRPARDHQRARRRDAGVG